MAISKKWSYIVGAAIAVLLQIAVAPNIHILNAVPNFILCYLVACAVSHSREVGYIMPFVLGLLYDLFSQGPIGAMALICVLAVCLASTVLKVWETDTIAFSIVVIILICFLAEFGYGLLLMACGMNVGFLEALVSICLPCGAYDTVIAIIAYPLTRRFVLGGKAQAEMSIIDAGIN